VSVSITLDGDALVYRTPYAPDLVAALKASVPYTDRKWDPARKAWLVAPQHAHTLADLAEAYLGESVSVPRVSVGQPAAERRLLDVRYVGRTKDRGDGERTAFGWAGGTWGVVFPERALRDWFNAGEDEARPGEGTTLYAVLGIKAKATGSDIKAAYRRLALQWHPDRCQEPDAAQQFRAVQHAYEVLTNPATRGRYDAGLALTATIPAPPRRPKSEQMELAGYRAPLRCGYLVALGREVLGRFVVETIERWEDVTDARGRVLVTSWPMGAEEPVERWL
jgi:hypothetical protein